MIDQLLLYYYNIIMHSSTLWHPYNTYLIIAVYKVYTLVWLEVLRFQNYNEKFFNLFSIFSFSSSIEDVPENMQIKILLVYKAVQYLKKKVS